MPCCPGCRKAKQMNDVHDKYNDDSYIESFDWLFEGMFPVVRRFGDDNGTSVEDGVVTIERAWVEGLIPVDEIHRLRTYAEIADVSLTLGTTDTSSRVCVSISTSEVGCTPKYVTPLKFPREARQHFTRFFMVQKDWYQSDSNHAKLARYHASDDPDKYCRGIVYNLRKYH